MNVCEEKMDEFLMLDKAERMPTKLCLHLLTCKSCRSKVRYFTLIERKSSKTLRNKMLCLKEEQVEKILKGLSVESSDELIQPVSFARWIFSGIFMVAAMLVFVVFGYNLGFVRLLSMWIYLLFGICIVVYGSMFIGSNMDFFMKKINFKKVDA